MELRQVRASLFYGDARYVDSLVCQPCVLGGAKRRYQPATRVYERLCATAARVLERHHLHDDELEGVQDAVGGYQVRLHKGLVTFGIETRATWSREAATR